MHSPGIQGIKGGVIAHAVPLTLIAALAHWARGNTDWLVLVTGPCRCWF